MSTTTTYTGVRIVDMPDLGTFTSTSSLVGEAAGSGRFSAAGLSGYFLPLSGGTITTDLTIGNSLTVDGAFFAGGDATLEKILTVDGAASVGGSLAVSGDSVLSGNLTVDGAASVGGSLAVSGDSVLSGNLTVDQTLTIVGAVFAPSVESSGYVVAAAFNAIPNGSFNCWNSGTEALQIFSVVGTGAAIFRNTLAGADLMIDDAGGSFIYSGGSGVAYKTGGGSWTAPSDARIKDVRGEYETGLAEVLALRPVRYVYKGNFRASEHDEVSPHAQAAKAGTEFIGLVAQEAETVMPEVVRQTEGWIDGARVADTRMLDPSALVYALVNAVRELAGRVGELEALVTTRETPTRGA